MATDAFAILDEMRAHGWHVAVHNDYPLGEEWFTFWLFTHGSGRYVKGEAATDLGALLECRRKARNR